MKLHDLSRLAEASPPFATVSIDATRVDPATEDDLGLRWRRQAQRLAADGVSDATLALLEDEVLRPTGLGGEHTRVVVADVDGVVLSTVLPGRPPRDESDVGPIPMLMPVARAIARFVPYAVVRLDRAGADIDVVTDTDLPGRHEDVEGGHELLHKVPDGGWSHRRYQARVEDSWAHNAAAVAEELDATFRREPVDTVLVTGDERAWGELKERLGGAVTPHVRWVEAGGRAAGVDDDAQVHALTSALVDRRRELRQQTLDEFAEQHNRQQRAVAGLEPVVEALRRGQVERMILRDDPTSTRRLFVGSGPLEIGVTPDEVMEQGEPRPTRVRADTALAWALVGSGAELVLVEDDPVDLPDGIGALLRWSDDATVHDQAPSMPGHGEPPGQHDTP